MQPQKVITIIQSIARHVKKQIIKQTTKVRMQTGPMRVTPDFIIIGAMRSGTTSLYKYLTSHPSIDHALKKEVHFFDNNYEKGMFWYRGHFPSFLDRYYFSKVHKRNLITGEASPYYLFYPHAPKRIAQNLPHAKLITILRNPVDRAYSHYWHEVEKGREPLSFEEAIRLEQIRLRGEKERIKADGSYYSFEYCHHSYQARGIYVEQLKTWLSLFPREQLLIIYSEDFYSDPTVILKQAFSFLDVSNCRVNYLQKYNRKEYPAMNPDTRMLLIEYFRPHNERLYALFGKNYDWDA